MTHCGTTYFKNFSVGNEPIFEAMLQVKEPRSGISRSPLTRCRNFAGKDSRSCVREKGFTHGQCHYVTL